MNANAEILMEAGTNELEVLVFGIESECFGINVAKVREVIKLPDVTKPPQTSSLVEGVINLRDQIIPIINLRNPLGYPVKDLHENNLVIVTEYHQQWFGFVADSVDTIVRLSWRDIEPPPDSMPHSNAMTGIAHINDKLVLMLDVETLTEPIIALQKKGASVEVNREKSGLRGQKRILAADDSGVIRTMVREKLAEAGYGNLDIAFNGQEAWDQLQKDAGYDLIITDIEMPQLDGLHLTKLIKLDAALKSIPVIIFSSIISEDNRNKGEQVGADMQISKPEIHKLVSSVDGLLNI